MPDNAMLLPNSSPRFLSLLAVANIAASSQVTQPPVPLEALPWVTHPRDRVDERFDSEAVASCLDAGRLAIDDHIWLLHLMVQALDDPSPSPTSCDAPGLTPFDGFWEGSWGLLPTRHLWASVTSEIQMVVLDDGGTVKVGVNIWSDGVLCGIVRGPSGRERLHQGHAFAATPHSPAYVKWLTPDRIYYERVSCGSRGRQYEIAEIILTDAGPRSGVQARYRAPRVDGAAFVLSADGATAEPAASWSERGRP
jgi:hypothetical protein